MKASLPSWLSGLFVLMVVPFFFVGGPDASSSFLLKDAWNFGHIIFFTVLMLLIQAYKPITGWRAWLWVTVIALAAGGLIEAAQHFVGRNASLDDILHNLFGVWLGLFWGQKPTPVIWVLRLISVLCITPAMWLVIDSGIGNLALRYQFPLLNSFESRHELQQIHPNNRQVKIDQTQSLHTHGAHAMRVSLDVRPYSGVNLITSYGDWTGHSVLLLDLYNPDSEVLDLVIRISDYQHDRGANKFNDRFNRRIVLAQGWNQVQIDLNDVRTAPRKRSMQMDNISGMAIFAAQLPRPREFYIDNIRLQ